MNTWIFFHIGLHLVLINIFQKYYFTWPLNHPKNVISIKKKDTHKEKMVELRFIFSNFHRNFDVEKKNRKFFRLFIKVQNEISIKGVKESCETNFSSNFNPFFFSVYENWMRVHFCLLNKKLINKYRNHYPILMIDFHVQNIYIMRHHAIVINLIEKPRLNC